MFYNRLFSPTACSRSAIALRERTAEEGIHDEPRDRSTGRRRRWDRRRLSENQGVYFISDYLYDLAFDCM